MDAYCVKNILKALIYIEDHINDEIKIEDLAKIACYSSFHFQRLFSFIVGESVYKYIKRLRMEKAIQKLYGSNLNITDIAFEAGFETPSAFTKAFRQCMGKSPRNYRKLYKEINMNTKKINDLPMIQPDEIKNIEEIPVLFIRRSGNYDVSSKEAWNAIKAFIKENNLDMTKLRYFSMGQDDPKITPEEKLRFDVCIQVPKDQKVSEKGEVHHKVIKGGKYAIFICKRPDAKGDFESDAFVKAMSDIITDAFDRIFLKWLPDSKENYDENRNCFMEHWGEITKIYVPLV